ncbi:MAG: PilZ domain-containing protein [Armatimonadetes bacterium]|nr:PilZ domain-containing protein [Armatimonadota bacterium]
MFQSLVNRVRFLFSGAPSVPTEERRQLIRLSCKIVALCSASGREFKVAVTDIGLNGMRLEAPEQLKKGQALQILCPNQPGGAIACEVVWCRQVGNSKSWSTGVRFSDSDENKASSWIKPALHSLGFGAGKIKERRTHVRVPANCRPRAAVANKAGDVLTEGSLLNLGIGGALVSLGVEVRPGMTIRLQLDPLGALPGLDLLSEVRSCKKDVRNQKWLHGMRFNDRDNPMVRRYMDLFLKDT